MNPMMYTEKLQDSLIKAVETSQRWTLGALRSTTSAFDVMTPNLTRFPLANRLPSPAETIDTTFAFASRLLEAQHAFLLGLLRLPAPAAGPVAAARPRVVRGGLG
jgi:hypothetical protein